MSVSRREQVVRSQKAGLAHTKIGHRADLNRKRVKKMAKTKATAKKKLTRANFDALLTTAEAAKLLNVHINTVRRWSNKGIIATYRIGPRGDRRLRQGDVDKLLRKSQPAKAT